MITGIDHLYLETKDIDRAKRFWFALGFEEVNSWGEGAHKACQLSRGNATLVLANTDSEPILPKVHFDIENVEEFNKRIEAQEWVKMTRPLEKTHWGTRMMQLEDPDGNQFSFEQRTQ